MVLRITVFTSFSAELTCSTPALVTDSSMSKLKMQNKFGNMELDVALICSCRLWNFVSSDESHFFFYVLTLADMDDGDGRSWR